jgi:hypothetical protein
LALEEEQVQQQMKMVLFVAVVQVVLLGHNLVEVETLELRRL